MIAGCVFVRCRIRVVGSDFSCRCQLQYFVLLCRRGNSCSLDIFAVCRGSEYYIGSHVLSRTDVLGC